MQGSLASHVDLAQIIVDQADAPNAGGDEAVAVGKGYCS